MHLPFPVYHRIFYSCILKNKVTLNFRSLLEKSANLEAELRATEPLKTDILQARNDCQKLHQHSQELGQQVRTLTAELQRARADVQLIPTLRNEIETLRSELQRARCFLVQLNPAFGICLLEFHVI